MALIADEIQEIKQGILKVVDKGAEKMLMAWSQRDQYQYPVKSSIREIVCNGLDAIQEREIAKSILTGKTKVEDHFVEKEDKDGLLRHSKFDASYYNLDYLSDDSNVYITYYEGKEMSKDRIEIKEYGIGLWGQRLYNYWQIGSSTKRLSKTLIGRYGVGNKSPLAVNDCFQTDTVYNGRKAKFLVYMETVQSIVPKFNLETGKENEKHSVVQADGSLYEFYTEETNEKNGLTVIIECKKHQREQFLDAVQQQLLYFQNIKLSIHNANGNVENKEVASPVLYEDSKIVITDNDYYCKPHIVVNGVNYGYIDWQELELNEVSGNVGIKVSAEEVDIAPNREHLIWRDNTKAIIIKRFKECAEIATNLIQAELNEPDFIKWLKVCANISGRSWDKKSVVSRLSHIIDINSLSPKFRDTNIRFTHNIFEPVFARLVTIDKRRKANQEIIKVNRKFVKFLGDQAHLPIIVCNDKLSNRKDKYLLQSVYTDGFIIVQQKHITLLEAAANGRFSKDGNKIPLSVIEKEMKDEATVLFNLIKSSKEVIDYNTIVVPDTFKGSEDEEDVIEDEEVQSGIALSHEERRKLEGKTVLFTPRNKSDLTATKNWNRSTNQYDYTIVSRFYEWQKVEIPIKEINDWEEEEIYYATDKTAEMMEFVALLTRDTRQEKFVFPRAEDEVNNHNFDNQANTNYGVHPDGTRSDERYRCSHFYFNKSIKLIKVSEANSKLYRDFYPITDFFLKFKNNKLTMSNILIKWNTARKILPLLNKVAFLYNYPFDTEKQEFYRTLVDYVKTNYREILEFKHQDNNVESAHKDLISHLDKVTEFQMFLATSPTVERIQEVSQELWGNSNITEACAIDYELWNKFQEVLEWAQPVSVILNQIDVLTGTDITSLKTPNSYLTRTKDVSLSEEVEQEIRWYSKHKNVI